MSPALSVTPSGFAAHVLELTLYPWQQAVLQWFTSVQWDVVKGTLCTPNGAGKDERVIASLALWWVNAHLRGRVVITSKDSRQI